MSNSSNPSSSNSDNYIMSIDPFTRLVRLTAKAFYDDFSIEGDNGPKLRGGTRGIAVVVLEALTRRTWVPEEVLAKELKLHFTQIRSTMEFLEKEKLVTRDQWKDTAMDAKACNAAVATTANNLCGREGEQKDKLHTDSYWCLNYAMIRDVVLYRLQLMRKQLTDELKNMNRVQEFVCPKCWKRYNALNVVYHCESCHTELVSQHVGDGDDIARERHVNLTNLLQKMEVELTPLADQLNRVKDLEAPNNGPPPSLKLREGVVAPDPTAGCTSNWALDFDFDSVNLSDDEH